MACLFKSHADTKTVQLISGHYIRDGCLIQLRNVEKYFEHGPTKTFVLRRINLDIREGDFVSVMGPSGAGKSTLLHLLGMHDSSWTGE